MKWRCTSLVGRGYKEKAANTHALVTLNTADNLNVLCCFWDILPKIFKKLLSDLLFSMQFQGAEEVTRETLIKNHFTQRVAELTSQVNY